MSKSTESAVWRDRPDDQWNRKNKEANDAFRDRGGKPGIVNRAAEKLKRRCPSCGRRIIVRHGKFAHHNSNYEEPGIHFTDFKVCEMANRPLWVEK